MNAIETAVAPLKSDAIARAAQEATKLVARVAADLEAAGNDREVAAPFPSYKLSREAYAVKNARYQTFVMLTTSRTASRRHGEPDLRDMDDAKIAWFVNMAQTDAAAQYDSFVAKLVAKIGEASTAVLVGNHVWSSSILTVETPNGTQNWKTQQIVNVSKLGKLFNQWPTRKVK